MGLSGEENPKILGEMEKSGLRNWSRCEATSERWGPEIAEQLRGVSEDPGLLPSTNMIVHNSL